MKKQQVIVIHGGDSYGTYEEYIQFLQEFPVDLDMLIKKGWKDTLEEKLGKNFLIIKPEMPNPWNAKYLEWKIWFEKLIPLFDDNLIFVGHSLGGIFLAKYLSENIYPKKIKATFLVAAPYDDKDSKYLLYDFNFSKDLTQFEKQGGQIYLYHSKDDGNVPFMDLDKYEKSLRQAIPRVFEDRGHFRQEELPELVKDILALK